MFYFAGGFDDGKDSLKPESLRPEETSVPVTLAHVQAILKAGRILTSTETSEDTTLPDASTGYVSMSTLDASERKSEDMKLHTEPKDTE